MTTNRKSPEPSAAYTRNLDKLAALLRVRPLTVKEIAKRLDCCRPTAYQRIAALEARGTQVFKALAPATSATGPRPLTYGVRAA